MFAYNRAMKISLASLTVAISLLSFGCAAPERTDWTSQNVHDILESAAKTHRVCGVAVAVIKNRRLDAIESATGCTPASTVLPDSVFQAASLSKPVFAYAVLKLVEQGKMALDTPVMQYLPQGYRHQFDPLQAQPTELVVDPRLQAVTVRMALNHTSGLPNWASGKLGFHAAPGTRWGYSGEGYVLLQRAVEAVTGQPLDQFMTAQVFKPLGMHHSSYAWNEGIAQRLLAGTKANGAPRTTLDLQSPVAAFSLYTSAEDYGKFLVEVLSDAQLLKQIGAAPVAVDPGLGLRWGLGWGLADDQLVWHWGNNTGYRAFVIASARTGDGFVMLTNSENGLKLAQPLAQKLLPGEHKVFQAPMLGDDILNIACNTVRLCL